MCAELACNDKERQAPFERISANPSEFIDAEYLPTGITLKDPHNMKLESIVAFFKHVAEREAAHGVPNAFRFKAVLNSRKKGKLIPARYKDSCLVTPEADDTEPQPSRRKRRKARKQINQDSTLLNFDEGTIVERSPDGNEQLPTPPRTLDPSAEHTDNLPSAAERPRRRRRQVITSESSTSTREPMTEEVSRKLIPLPVATGLNTPQETPAPDDVVPRRSQRHVLLTPESTQNQTSAVISAQPSSVSQPRRSQRKETNVSKRSKGKNKNSSRKK